MLIEQSTVDIQMKNTSEYLSGEIFKSTGINVGFALNEEDNSLSNEQGEDLNEVEELQNLPNEVGVTKETYSNYGLSLEQAIYMQMNAKPMISKNNGWVSAEQKEVITYLSPTKYNIETYKYQFLDLSASANIGEEILGEYLKNKGILNGMEKVFIEAGKKYNVNEIYLVAHALLETGNGESMLANGIAHNGVVVYNMFGIGAVDSNPIVGGASYAYKMGWTTPEKAIEGGVKYISDNYVNHELYAQDTLYEMRWNPARPCTHQYATDVAWAVKQAKRIEQIYNQFETANKTFDIPIYR